jgi:hypothetical protein
VEVSALQGTHRGYAVLVNHGHEASSVSVRTQLPIHALRLITPDGATPIQFNGRDWKMEIKPYEGAVVEWNE